MQPNPASYRHASTADSGAPGSPDWPAVALICGPATIAASLLTHGTTRVAIASIGAALTGGGIVASAARAPSPESPVSPQPIDTVGPGADHAPDWRFRGRDIAVAWWPENLDVEWQRGGGRLLRFETIVGNLGSVPVPIESGDHVHYEIMPQLPDGRLGPVVASGRAPLDRLDVEPFPPPFGEEIGHPSSAFGQHLERVSELAPRTTGIVGPLQGSQEIDVSGLPSGIYVLRQSIVSTATDRDADHVNDVRETAFTLDGPDVFELSSAYAGPAA